MLKPPSESSQLLKRLKFFLTLSTDCKVNSDIRKNWNNNVDLLISDSRIQNLSKNILKLSNNNTKLNMLIVRIININSFYIVLKILILSIFSFWLFHVYQMTKY